ncbi:hypothetical protein FR943_03605 [Mycobacterium sp. TNTM28]|uniref:Uncharacterized protein n=1 Tax=[Mycobacterium] fortunisiensis TaxID=2600579 RepID=A0ABS6KHE4_9MYCO|nr:hypothetical protein [[Mycobacterium] fortunisiensis]MBU9762938.1 hypothetical protein [[Mycobacterium] fortunisiensis]
MHQPYPGPPPKKGGALKWILGGIALLAIIALTVVLTITLSGHDNNGNGSAGGNTASGSDAEFASANDTGPITIITEDPSCAAWSPVVNTLSDNSKRNGWSERNASVPASAWSPEQRRQFQEVGDAMRAATDQVEPLIKVTTHRVMCQLYEQFIAYTSAYVDKIPTYTEPDNALARTSAQASNTLTAICDAITYRSAASRAPLVPAAPSPANVAAVSGASNPERFLTSPDPVCPDWVAAADQFESDTADWRQVTNVNIPISEWTPEQKAATDAVLPLMRQSADTMENLGQRSENPVFHDFAQLAAQYRRAYAQALPTYSKADRYLYDVGIIPVGMIRRACEAAG